MLKNFKQIWLFSHGKGSCDGIGGTLKHQAHLESLRRQYRNTINTAERVVGTRGFHSFVPKDLKNIYVSRTSSGQKYTDLRRVSS